MSEKKFEENFWAKIEKDGGFKLGEEMIVMAARSNVGKTSFAHEYLLEVAEDKERDYNGPQSEFDFGTLSDEPVNK